MSVPEILTKPAHLAYLATLLAWRDGDEVPEPPPSLTDVMPLPKFMALLDVRENREYVVRRLSLLVKGRRR